MILRPATADDLVSFYGHHPRSTMRAVVAEHDGRILGVAGLMRTPNGLLAVSEITDELRRYPLVIMRAGRIIADMARKSAVPVYAVASDKEANSAAFLERLGFVCISESREGGLFQWQE